MKKALLLLLAVALLVGLGIFFYDNGRIAEGVFIEGIPVGGMRYEQVLELCRSLSPKYDAACLISAADYRQWVSFKELGLRRDYIKATETAYQVGREQGIFLRLRSKLVNARFGTYVRIKWVWDEQKAYQLAAGIADSLFAEPRSASCYIDKSGAVSLSADAYGLAVDVEESVRQAEPAAIADGIWQLKTESIPPAISLEAVQAWQINGELASYSSRFDVAQIARSQNIRLAAAALDNALLMPGEEFSFNNTTGARTAAKGYRNAYIIVNNRFEMGMGGGVCQVSSTLYNAVLKAGLSVTERFPHSLSVTYVPKGKDAAVSYGTLDFKFVNTTDRPIIVHSEYKKGVLKISLFGHIA